MCQKADPAAAKPNKRLRSHTSGWGFDSSGGWEGASIACMHRSTSPQQSPSGAVHPPAHSIAPDRAHLEFIKDW